MTTPREGWREKLMDDFCVMFERATRDLDAIDWVERLEGFIEDLIASERAEAEQQAPTHFENTMQFVKDLQHRCPECGVETQTRMTWLESYKINALWGRCFQCATKNSVTGSLPATEQITNITN